MTAAWVLDADAVTALTDVGHAARARAVARVVVTAARLRHTLIVPAVILAECQRGARHTRRIDSLLAREPGLRVRNTDRVLARYVGAVLYAAKAGSDLLADAHCVATAVEAGGGVVVTADPTDMARLASSFRTVVIETL